MAKTCKGATGHRPPIPIQVLITTPPPILILSVLTTHLSLTRHACGESFLWKLMLLLFTASGHSARKLLRIFSILRHKSFGAGKFILTFSSPVWQSNILKVKCRRKNNGKMFFTLGWFPAFIVATNRKHFISGIELGFYIITFKTL